MVITGSAAEHMFAGPHTARGKVQTRSATDDECRQPDDHPRQIRPSLARSEMADSCISELTKIKVHSLKRKAPSSVQSSGKRKRFKSDDSASVLSLKTAYGVHKAVDDSDSEDDLCSSAGTSVDERPCDFVKLDASQLNKQNGVLFSEDLSNDYEIWTLQCPDDVDINTFLNQSISFNGVSRLPIKNSISSRTELIPYRNLNDTNITIVTPCERTKSLSLNVVPLAGTLIMSHQVKKVTPAKLNPLPIDTIEDASRRRSQLMSKITERLSNKFVDTVTTKNCKIKEEFKLEIESPSKAKKSKKKKRI